MQKRVISYIIGFRFAEKRRLDNLLLTLQWLINVKYILQHTINLQIIVIEQDSVKKLDIPEVVKDLVEHLFIYNAGYYNRGWAFNVGYKCFAADYYFFADNDIIMNTPDFIHVLSSCFKYEAVNPYAHIYDSTKEYVTDTGFDPCAWKNPRVFSERQHTCFSGGIVGIGDHAMCAISGWDERFRGRGWEDYAFTVKINLFLYSIHTYSFLALHLWHPFECDTTRLINERLNSEYAEYTFHDYVDMIELHTNFGSPIKYSTSKVQKHRHKHRLSDSRHNFGCKYYSHAWKKFLNRGKVFLYLCNQLDNSGEESGFCNTSETSSTCTTV